MEDFRPRLSHLIPGAALVIGALLLWLARSSGAGSDMALEVANSHLRRVEKSEVAVREALAAARGEILRAVEVASKKREVSFAGGQDSNGWAQRLSAIEVQISLLKSKLDQWWRASSSKGDGNPSRSIIKWDDPLYLERLKAETKEKHEKLKHAPVTDPLWTTPYVQCILSRMPAAFFEPPSEVIVANETLHMQYIFYKHHGMLVLAKPYCALRVVTFRVDRVTAMVGGTGDRAKGFATTVMLALMSNSQFAPYWYNPNNVEEYFHFPRMDISSPEPELDVPYVSDAERLYLELLNRYNESTGRLVRVMVDNPGLSSATMDWNQMLGESVHFILHYNFPNWVNLTENQFYIPMARLYGLYKMNWIKQFRLIQHHFFDNPRKELKEAMDAALARVPPRSQLPFRVGVQLRTGRGEWGEPKTQGDEPLCFAREAVKLCERLVEAKGAALSTPCSYYLTSDSAKAKDAMGTAIKSVQSGAFVLIIDQPHIYHIERDQGGALNPDLIARRHQFVDHWLEWRLLFQMDALVISRSGFAESAAWGIDVPTRAAHRPHGKSDNPCLFREFDRNTETLKQALQ